MKFLFEKQLGIYEATSGYEDKNGFLMACEQGNFKIVKFLIEKNHCGINDIDTTRTNGFLYACQKGHFQIMKFLFEKNCGIEQIDSVGRNGFLYACGLWLWDKYDI